MSEVTYLADVADLVKKFWSPIAVNSLKQDTHLASLVSKEYQGEIKEEGDTVYVSELQDMVATRKGSGDNTFESQKVKYNRVGIVADQTITAAIEIPSLVNLESQIKVENSAIRQQMITAIEVAVNDYLYGLVSRTTPIAALRVSGVSDFNFAALSNLKKLASKNKWSKAEQWYLMLDPNYHAELSNNSVATSADYGNTKPIINGQFTEKRQNFNIIEDNSDGLTRSLAGGVGNDDAGLAFLPSFLNFVMAEQVAFKLSDLHAVKQHGFLLSAHIICGAALGNNAAKKHAVIYNS